MGRCVALGVRLLISVHSVAGDLRIDQAGIHRKLACCCGVLFPLCGAERALR
jgi:hypothetical protein